MKHKQEGFTSHLLRATKRKFQYYRIKGTGFTLIEIILVVGIFAILLTVSMAAFGSFRDDSQLQNTTNDIQAVLRLAQNKTVASEGAEQYGVYFNVSSSPHEYILFGGASYASGAVETIYRLSDLVQFSSTIFSGLSGQEVVFDRIQGTTTNYGEVVLQSTLDAVNTRIISVSGGGSIEVSSTPLGNEGNCQSDPDPGNRACDSRHVHVTYAGRQINTATEEITLNFDSGVKTETIVIANNLSGGQIVWEGTINVGGEDQKIKLHTHQLNGGPGLNETQFSIHRDKRFNTKSLVITLSGGSPNNTLIEYDAGGVVTPGDPFYVTATQEQ